MATKTILLDDMDKSIDEDVQSVQFSVGNRSYVIDLGAENRQKLEDALNPFIKHASATGRTAAKRSAVPASDIRAWAKQQPEKISGLIKSDKGPLPKAVKEAYNKAHGTKY
ncbi:histone-like nucleoid-structuring protein Lsr2 [Nesterenkonia cremea]|uniref:Lsr2 dimerization domain-containing protein n=1 Tax=Nesterenkonia cremea TaxID=1882340 RepID=A0A917AS63_9MICC|nr:Lsr2 family protein [Nesterenkonia cremea]GGE71119.1 hypothetical protein GCM10011401_17800 [Nesterenkonia cremea]